MNYLPGLASNDNPPELCLLSTWDYRREPLVPTYLIFWPAVGFELRASRLLGRQLLQRLSLSTSPHLFILNLIYLLFAELLIEP
jgi:hypothetical protein